MGHPGAAAFGQATPHTHTHGPQPEWGFPVPTPSHPEGLVGIRWAGPSCGEEAGPGFAPQLLGSGVAFSFPSAVWPACMRLWASARPQAATCSIWPARSVTR